MVLLYVIGQYPFIGMCGSLHRDKIGYKEGPNIRQIGNRDSTSDKGYSFYWSQSALLYSLSTSLLTEQPYNQHVHEPGPVLQVLVRRKDRYADKHHGAYYRSSRRRFKAIKVFRART